MFIANIVRDINVDKNFRQRNSKKKEIKKKYFL